MHQQDHPHKNDLSTDYLLDEPLLKNALLDDLLLQESSEVWLQLQAACAYDLQIKQYKSNCELLTILCIGSLIYGRMVLFPLLIHVVFSIVPAILVLMALLAIGARRMPVTYARAVWLVRACRVMLMSEGVLMIASISFKPEMLPLEIIGCFCLLLLLWPLKGLSAVVRSMEEQELWQPSEKILELIERIGSELKSLHSQGDESIISIGDRKTGLLIKQLRLNIVVIHDTATGETAFTTRDNFHIVYHGTSFLGGRNQATITWNDRVIRRSMKPEIYERYQSWKNAG